VLQLYKENLEALNAQFGMHRHPPSMYLSVSSAFLEMVTGGSHKKKRSGGKLFFFSVESTILEEAGPC